MILKTLFVLILLYFVIFQPYWFTVGCFIAALYLAASGVDERKKGGRW